MSAEVAYQWAECGVSSFSECGQNRMQGNSRGTYLSFSVEPAALSGLLIVDVA